MKFDEKHEEGYHHGKHKHFIINLAFHVVTLAAALATLNEIEKVHRRIKAIEDRHRK